MVTMRPFIRGIGRTFAPLGGVADRKVRRASIFQGDGLERDRLALIGDGVKIAADLKAAMDKHAPPVR
ncbi:MAG: hypothetical protein BWY85_00141 [Firmicutes bacterium ADurb.Bin506]|nr:MAG: hypothetical protein BWY85_00141 [Firmicutes bacterium ADurb.Bin506]